MERRHHDDEHGELAVRDRRYRLVFVKCPGMPSSSKWNIRHISQVKIASTPGKLLACSSLILRHNHVR